MFCLKVAESRFERAKAGAVLKEVKKNLGCITLAACRQKMYWQICACKCRGYSTA